MRKLNLLLPTELFIVFLALTACESWQLRSREETLPKTTGGQPSFSTPGTTQPQGPAQNTGTQIPKTNTVNPEFPQTDQPTILPPQVEASTKVQAVPKIGVIIGPGHLRAFIAIGVLQELQKAKIPIHAVLGLEWGSVPAALFSLHGQANEIEWQMMKLKEKDFPKKGLISQKIEGEPINNLDGFLMDAFSNSPLEQMKIPFTCLSLDLNKRQYFWMRRGDASKVLKNCITHPPYFYSDSGLVAGVDLKLSADYLRQMGASYIIFVNILPLSGDPFEKKELSYSTETLWANHQQTLARTAVGTVDFVIDTTSIPYKSLDFESRRDMVRKGQELGHSITKKLSQKLGL
jgi:NTE family protein